MVWDPKLHPRYPPGTPKPPGAGTFMKKGSPHWAAAVSASMGAPPTPVAGKSTPRPAKAAKKVAAAAAPNPTVKSSIAAHVSTDAELDTRAKAADRAVSGTQDSASLHMRGGRWSSARAAVHQQIVDDLWKRATGVPTDHKAILVGGMSGAGKGSVLAQHPTVGQYLMLNPDDAKEALAARGLIPDVPGHPELSPLERVGLVHQESVHITEMLAQRAYAAGTNVMWDATMGVSHIVQGRVSDLRRNKYSVGGLFVDVPFAVGAARVKSRYRAGQREYEQGRGHGGRLVPDWVVAAANGSNGKTVNRANFDSLRRAGSFDTWELWDNSGAAPVLKRQG